MGTAGIAGNGEKRIWPDAFAGARSSSAKRKPPTSVRASPEPGQRSVARPDKPAWNASLESFLPGPAEARERWPLLVRIGTDIAVAIGSVGTAAFLMFSIGAMHDSMPTHLNAARFWVSVGLMFGVLFTLLCHSEGLYEPLDRHSRQATSYALLKASSWTALIIGTLTSLPGEPRQLMDLRLLALAAVLHLAGALLARKLRENWIDRQALRGNGVRNVLVLGTGTVAQALVSQMESDLQLRRVFRGFLADGSGYDPRIIGGVEDLRRLVRSEFADELIVALPPGHPTARRAFQEAAKLEVEVKIAPDLSDFQTQLPRLQFWGRIPILSLREQAIPAFGLFLKRSVDIAASAVSLGLLSPALVLIAAWVRLDSAGPALYRSPRVGKKGRQFQCYKFRTMIQNADQGKDVLRQRNERAGPFFKMKADPRITRLGRFLRRYSLDELPQLWNVLKGDMSLVGPRPHPVDDCARYEVEHLRRLAITPGLTGLWQVTARGDPSFERSMRLDLEYIEKWSLWVDLQILARTLLVVAGGSGI